MNKVAIRIEIEEEDILIDFEAPYGKGELRATLNRLRGEIFDYIEDDYTTVEYDCVGVFLNGVQAHIFDKEWVGYMGCGSVPVV